MARAGAPATLSAPQLPLILESEWPGVGLHDGRPPLRGLETGRNKSHPPQGSGGHIPDYSELSTDGSLHGSVK